MGLSWNTIEIRNHLTWPKMVGSITRLPKWDIPHAINPYCQQTWRYIHVFLVDQQNCHTSWKEF